MDDLILYNYPLSPFSEKIRVMLGYAGIPWHSVTVKEMPPRPELEALAGGYRKIPVAQIGADVFCDTRTIAREIGRLGNKPELVLEQQSADVQEFVRAVDLDIFLACIVTASGPGMLWQLIRSTSLIDAARFLKDRIDIGKKARIRPMGRQRAKSLLQQHLRKMEAMLTQAFLFGPEPCIADFSAYHSLWFACDLAGKPLLQDYPAVSGWMDRMRHFGHGEATSLGKEEALDRAQAATPRTIENNSEEPLCGTRVQVAPADYGRDPVTGTLLHADERELVVAHQHPRVGLVHLHFPRQGFELKAANQEGGME